MTAADKCFSRAGQLENPNLLFEKAREAVKHGQYKYFTHTPVVGTSVSSTTVRRAVRSQRGSFACRSSQR